MRKGEEEKENIDYTNYLFILPAFTSGGWAPLGEDCDFQQKLVRRGATNLLHYSVSPEQIR